VKETQEGRQRQWLGRVVGRSRDKLETSIDRGTRRADSRKKKMKKWAKRRSQQKESTEAKLQIE
jgi:hypothetical protein